MEGRREGGRKKAGRREGEGESEEGRPSAGSSLTSSPDSVYVKSTMSRLREQYVCR